MRWFLENFIQYIWSYLSNSANSSCHISLPYWLKYVSSFKFIFIFSKPSRSYLCCPYILGCVAIHCSLDNLPRETPLKNLTHSPSICQIPIAPQLRSRSSYLPLFSMLRSCQAWVCANLVHAVTTVLVHILTFHFLLRKHCFLVVIHHVWLLQSFAECPTRIKSHGRWRYEIDVPNRTENSTVSYFLNLGKLWISF